KVTIIVQHESREIKIAVKAHHQFKKVFEAAGTLKFSCNGKRLRETDTPESVDIEDGDLIDANLEQIGGGLSS
ncbi:hypothetical protein DFH11DRAFT_1612600, partial [Phellopilus nigrolimitatus]